MGNFIKFIYTLQCLYSCKYIINTHKFCQQYMNIHELNSHIVSFIALMVIKMNKIYMYQKFIGLTIKKKKQEEKYEEHRRFCVDY